MKWPLMLRSTHEREMDEPRRTASEARARADEWRTLRDDAERKMHRAHAELASARAGLADVMNENALRVKAATTVAEQAVSERIRAEVRAQEWEAIAMELIQKGAGRPKIDREAEPLSPLAKKIREEAGGDVQLSNHFWKNVVAPARAAGKKDEEIVGMIGWETGDPPSSS